MDRLDTLQLFTRIVETGSFSRSADMLGIPRASATHAIKQLEARLGTRLLDRTTRQVAPTQDGSAFYERCVLILSELDDAEASLRHVASNPRGVLRVDMHGTHATQVVLPRIGEFHRRYPEIELVVSSGDRLVDLVREGVDCVVRGGRPHDSSLVARRLAMMPQVLCASPAYLAEFGVPAHPDELASHQAVRFFSSSGNIDYPVSLVVDGEVRDYDLGGWMSVNDAENYVVACESGGGLIQLPRFHVAAALREGRLVEVLPAWRSPDLPLTALYPYRRQLSPRVRVFVDWLREVYAELFGPAL
ncbi:LysR family transcriptional regulator [Burkholderia plantarii]|uniref:Putative HTH-type transcriptional regulator yhjC n=1 Tax=Burkholderia plantarii TaxID=41899 RepID=A0A0B6RVY6_BURPL|nr:LysR family transcriptional regulator [Burkholderia plantarii]AJK49507.1 putative HTH-type transcriptional regulator yhjC [Burkholderia plantarii]ALK33741.1 LysR family transcriptional regulator [Burkholderia plantarii]WLE62760.1 LysR family transcriptional regulator [Burkholderia plantarii]GLZ16916.1 LysR family transcriptional regulator [Burkholderia plantarii]